jgi:hypothetical protein
MKNITKLPKTKGMFFKLSPTELSRLNQISENMNIGNSHFLRLCIDLFWFQLQVEKGIEKGEIKIGEEVITLNLSELALVQQEMAQIFSQIDWGEIITLASKPPLKRLKKPIKVAS